MPIQRRHFMRTLGALAGLAACHRASDAGPETRPPASGPGAGGVGPALAPEPVLLGGERLKILVLGGTGFLGPHLVEAMQQRGHAGLVGGLELGELGGASCGEGE